MRQQEALSGAAHSASTLGVDTSELTYAAPARSHRSRGGTASNALDSIAGYVRHNPWYAAVIGIGAGILLGILIPNRR